MLLHVLDVATLAKNNVTELMQAACSIHRRARICSDAEVGHCERSLVIHENKPCVSTYSLNPFDHRSTNTFAARTNRTCVCVTLMAGNNSRKKIVKSKHEAVNNPVCSHDTMH